MKRNFALVLSLGLVLLTIWLVHGALAADAAFAFNPDAELNVCPSGCPYSSVQAAVDAANPGDVIKVAQGTYTGIHIRAGITQVVYISKTVTVRGGYTTSDWNTSDPAAHPTTLDAQGKGRVLYINGADIAPTVEGLCITGGDAQGLGGDPWGSDAGGAIFINITVNTTPAVVKGNYIFGNTAYNGGGVFVNYSDNVSLEGNTIISNTASGGGGGLYLAWSDATLTANAVLANAANWAGGGLALNHSNATLFNNTITDNRAGNRGSGLFIYSASPRMFHTTLARNGGGDGSGLYADDTGMPGAQSTVALTNTIITSHTLGIVVTQRNTATLNATLWYANGTDQSGAGTIHHTNDHSGDSAFKSDGYHLAPNSAAIDKGVSAGVNTDIDGEARPMDAGYDLGADETANRFFVYLPLTLKKR